MRSRTREMTRLLLTTSQEATSHPSLLLPAAILLLPTLALQLAVPHLLRTRLAPSIWTVVVGSFALAWVTQVATMAACAFVDARRRGREASIGPMARASLVSGSLVLLGLLAGGLPGLWLQARYAFASLETKSAADVRRRLAASAASTRPMRASLIALAVVSLVISLLGQSLAAGIAEASGTIVATGTTDGRTTFSLSYVPHALTSLLAFAIAVASAGLYSIGVSVARERLDVRGAIAVPRRSQPLAPAMLRVLLWTGGVTMVLGAVAAVFKVQQHL